MTQVVTQQQSNVAVKRDSVKSLFESEAVQKRFKEILGAKAAGFISSVLNVVNSNNKLKHADPNSILMASAIAATMDLPINPNLGFAHIVPYELSVQENGQWIKKTVAQFQMGWKGFVQLAERTGQYKTIGVTEIYAGQLKKYNPLTSEHEFDFSITGGEVIGYAAYFKLLNGFEKVVYWNVSKTLEHAKKYSKAFQYDLKHNKKSSVWSTDFDSQGKKTLVKELLSKWGIMSIEMQNATKFDQAVIESENGDVSYVDNTEYTDVTDQAAIAETSTTTEANTNAENGANVNVPSADQL